MKGLLIKEWYALTGLSNFKATILFAVASLGFAFIGGMDGLLLFTPMVAAMLPRSVLAYDEINKWQQFSLAMPYSRKDIVSAKYIMTFGLGCGASCAAALAYSIANLLKGTFAASELGFILFLGIAVGLLIPSVSVPIDLKYGTANGKVFSMIWGGVMGCSGGILASVAGKDGMAKLTSSGIINYLPYIAGIAALVIFAVSWAISIRIFEKKDF